MTHSLISMKKVGVIGLVGNVWVALAVAKNILCAQIFLASVYDIRKDNSNVWINLLKLVLFGKNSPKELVNSMKLILLSPWFLDNQKKLKRYYEKNDDGILQGNCNHKIF